MHPPIWTESAVYSEYGKNIINKFVLLVTRFLDCEPTICVIPISWQPHHFVANYDIASTG